MTPLPDFPRLLERHGAAMRSLARELVHGADVDDVVQETWHRALRHPPHAGEGIGAWLATVLRHVAWRWRRASARRSRHEGLAAEATPSECEDVARAVVRSEVARRLLAAVDALEPPFRDAIWQRYFEARPPRAIAAATGVPLATVKSRLQRGLVTLRTRLAADTEVGREDWRGALAAAFGLGEPVAAAVTGGGGMLGGVLVAMGTKFVLAATLVIAAAVCWPRADGASVPDPVTAVDAGNDVAPVALAAVTPPREAGVAAATRSAAASSAPAVDVAPATIRGRCADEAGNPVAGCRVELHGSVADARMVEWLLGHVPPQWADPGAVTTSRDGDFALRFVPPPPFRFDLRVHSSHHGAVTASWAEIPAGAVIELGDVTMQAGRRLIGRLVDTEGAPVAGTLVCASRIDERQIAAALDGELRPDSASVRSDAHGELAFEPTLAAGSYRIESKGEPMLAPMVVEIRADREPAPVVVVVDRPEQVSIRGRVIDDSGMPVPDAEVMAQPKPRGVFWRTRADGRFEVHMPRREVQGSIDVVATCNGYQGQAVARAVAWGRGDLVLTLPRAAQLVLGVVDALGRPVEDFTVALLERKRMRSADGTVRARGPFAGGLATIAGVERGEWLAVIGFGEGSGLANATAPFVVETAATVHVQVTAHAIGERRVAVVDDAGRPVAGTELVLCEPLDGELDAATRLVTVQTHSQVGGAAKAWIVAMASTDAEGLATLRGPLERSLALALPGEVHVPRFVRDVRLDDATTLVVTVSRGVRLRARLAASALAALRTLCGVPEGRAFGSEQRPRLVMVGAGGRTIPMLVGAFSPAASGPGCMQDDGSFVHAGLRAERFTMCLMYKPTGGGIEQLDLGPIDLTDGQDREIELTVPQLRLGTLAGCLTVNGEPAVVRELRLEGAATRSLTTDGEGRFSTLLPVGTYRVLAQLTGRERRAVVPVAEQVTVRADEVTTLALSPQTGRLCVRLLDAEGRPAARVHLVARIGGSDVATVLPSTQADGTLEVELPVGSLVLALHEPLAARRGMASTGPAAGNLCTTTIDAGGTTSLELRLPTGADKQ